MPLYDITATNIWNYTARIEAASAEEALKKAEEELSPDDFEVCGHEFTVDYADLVEEPKEDPDAQVHSQAS